MEVNPMAVYEPTTIHGNTTPKIIRFMVTAVKTSNFIFELVCTERVLGRRNDEIVWLVKTRHNCHH
jgi:hypothetical protein